MKNLLRLFASAIVAMSLAACSGTPDVKTSSADFVKVTNGILTSSYGKTLYTFDKDQAGSGKSECVSTCADNWPPVYVEPGIKISGDFSVITRSNGQKQLTYKGKPLYFFVKDKNPGDKTGDNVNNVWHVVAP
jgi:predicted lipoprotein with Yx(FWY)xxD motif